VANAARQRWNVHDHRDELRVSDHGTIYHYEKGQLCYWELHYDCVLYFPIHFKTREAAWKWIREGCIADLQEGLSTLHVGFSKTAFELRKPFGEEDDGD
jgi:hypothetical protein